MAGRLGRVMSVGGWPVDSSGLGGCILGQVDGR